MASRILGMLPLPPAAIFSKSFLLSQLSFSGWMGPRDPGGGVAQRAALMRSGRRSVSSPMVSGLPPWRAGSVSRLAEATAKLALEEYTAAALQRATPSAAVA